jgi:hypothetical protein
MGVAKAGGAGMAAPAIGRALAASARQAPARAEARTENDDVAPSVRQAGHGAASLADTPTGTRRPATAAISDARRAEATRGVHDDVSGSRRAAGNRATDAVANVATRTGVQLDAGWQDDPALQHDLTTLDQALAFHGTDIDQLLELAAGQLGPDATAADIIDTLISLAGFIGKQHNG